MQSLCKHNNHSTASNKCSKYTPVVLVISHFSTSKLHSQHRHQSEQNDT